MTIDSGQLWVRKNADQFHDNSVVIINRMIVADQGIFIINYFRMVQGKSIWTVCTEPYFEKEYVPFVDWSNARDNK